MIMRTRQTRSSISTALPAACVWPRIYGRSWPRFNVPPASCWHFGSPQDAGGTLLRLGVFPFECDALHKGDTIELCFNVASFVERQPAAHAACLAGRTIGKLRVGVQAWHW